MRVKRGRVEGWWRAGLALHACINVNPHLQPAQAGMQRAAISLMWHAQNKTPAAHQRMRALFATMHGYMM